jgi:hypothetical protein
VSGVPPGGSGIADFFSGYNQPRRRQHPLRWIIIVVVLLASLIGVDFAVRAFAEGQMAPQVQQHGFPKKRQVQLRRPPRGEATLDLVIASGSATWRVTSPDHNKINIHLVSSSGLPGELRAARPCGSGVPIPREPRQHRPLVEQHEEWMAHLSRQTVTASRSTSAPTAPSRIRTDYE